jgi:hypothetical protein
VLYNHVATRSVDTIKQIITGPERPCRGKLVCDGLELYDFIANDQ